MIFKKYKPTETAKIAYQKLVPLMLVLLFAFANTFGQNTDSLFYQARELAFDKQYDQAIDVCNSLLNQKPEYLDAKVLKARIYSWKKDYHNAQNVLEEILNINPGHSDALSAMFDVKYWSRNYPEALKQANIGISFHPEKEEFHLNKAKALLALEEFDQAEMACEDLLRSSPENEEALRLLQRIEEKNQKNRLALKNNYEYFNEPYTNNWYLWSLEYARKTRVGTIIGRVNLSDFVLEDEKLFEKNTGYQFEVDAYPKLAENLSGYFNYGYSPSGLFPKHRAGAELYASLPASFEASLGTRYMYYPGATEFDSNKNIYILTGSVGKYYKNYWFSFRTFLTPKNDDISHSYFLQVRRYFSTAQDYLNLLVGTGTSPDELSGSNTNYRLYRLNSKKIKIGYHKPITTRWTIYAEIGYENEEYRENQKRDKFVTKLDLSYNF